MAFGNFEAPAWVMKVFVTFVILGFPPAVLEDNPRFQATVKRMIDHMNSERARLGLGLGPVSRQPALGPHGILAVGKPINIEPTIALDGQYM